MTVRRDNGDSRAGRVSTRERSDTMLTVFKRIRQLQISLAAKCQLLFGAAVVLIIAAALFVPAYRIEKLMEQLDVNAGRMLADQLMTEHVQGGATQGVRLYPQSAKSTTRPTTQPDEWDMPPRLISTQSTQLSRFEKRALIKLNEEPDPGYYDTYSTPRDGQEIYLYGQAVYFESSCLACHDVPSPTTAPTIATRSRSASTTSPATQPASTDADDDRSIYGLISVAMPSHIEPNQLLLNRVFILTAGLLAGTLAVFVFYLITTRLILQPVRVLQETAEKVSQGDLNIRSDINTGDEFQQLAETFNTMLTNLKLGADQLRAVNKSLDLKLGQLAETNVTLYESNRLKSEFLANVSHELRTPLNSILGFAELLHDALEDSPDAKTTRYVQNIVSSGRNLLDLINDLLDLAKIEAGRMEVRSEPLSLSDLFEGLINIIKPICTPRQLTIADSVATDVPILHTDPAKLQQILYNFLSNAIKFSPQNATIALTARREGEDRVRIEVADQGPGINRDKHEIIFEKFRQLDGGVTRQHGGSGLGLAISKELVTLLGGSIGVISEPGHGSTFWIILPLRIESGAQDVRGKLALT